MIERFDDRICQRTKARKTLSYVTYTSIVPPPKVLRPAGVSAITVAKNEEDWVQTSIRSIVPSVDEILVADDHSDDGTPEILEAVSQAFPEKVRLITFPREDFIAGTNLMIRATRYRWILRWHADFVARVAGQDSMPNLLRAVLTMDPMRHVCLALSGVVLDGDLEHQFPDRRDPPEPFLYTYSPWLGYRVKERWESLHVPWFYEKAAWPSAPYFHMRSVKSSKRLLQRLYWSRWFEERNRGSNESLNDFIRRKATADFGVSTVEEAARRHVIEEFQGCVPFSREVCGDHPEAIRSILGDPPYRLVYSDGRLVDRIERRSRRLRGDA